MKSTLKILIFAIITFYSSYVLATNRFDGAEIISHHIHNELIKAGQLSRSFYKIDFTSKFDEHLLSAKAGNAQAQYHIGQMYQYSKKLDVDYEKSAFWLKKAAKQNHPLASFYLGDMYNTGIGVSENSKTALHHYMTAAKAGHAEAQALLGVDYIRGDGLVIQNLKKGFYWSLKSANQGFNLGLASVSESYLYGRGTVKNIEEGVKWAIKLALMGNVDQFQNIGIFYQYREKKVNSPIEAYKFYLIHEAIKLSSRNKYNLVNTQKFIKSILEKLTNKEKEEAEIWVENWFKTNAQNIQ